MENLLANTHELKGKMKEKVEGAKDLGLLSKISNYYVDVPISFHAKNFELNQPNLEKVTELFNELEFRNLLVNFTRTFAVNIDPSEKHF